MQFLINTLFVFINYTLSPIIFHNKCISWLVNIMSNYGSWNLKELKIELKKRGARLSGRKRELVERLESYDRNKNFGKEDEEDTFSMNLPDPALYRDINAETVFTNFPFEAVEVYLKQMDKKMDDDAKNLYTNRFLKYVRLATEDLLFYIKSECRAQMRKTVTYNIDICIDSDGTVIEAQCECAAGMGPTAHCKHVCALLFALFRFSTLKEIVTEETCTQRLQTFNQCKPFSGSPIKASKLPLKANDNVDYDPRPRQFRQQETYSDYFRNICLNYKGIHRLPISQTFEPANTYAVTHDHCYTKVSQEDQWLSYEKITNISDDDIKYLEDATRKQSNNKIWITERRKRLTSSNFGRICKATDCTDKAKLAVSLTYHMDISAPAIKHGKKYETVAVKKYEEMNDRKTSKCGLFIYKQHPYLAVSPDAIAENGNLVEVKCPYSARNDLITPDTVPYIKEENERLVLDKNHNYYYQVQGQLLCTGKQRCDFVVYTFQDLVFIPVQRDDMLIDAMFQKMKLFYNDYFRQALLDKYYYQNYYKYSFNV